MVPADRPGLAAMIDLKAMVWEWVVTTIALLIGAGLGAVFLAAMLWHRRPNGPVWRWMVRGR